MGKWSSRKGETERACRESCRITTGLSFSGDYRSADRLIADFQEILGRCGTTAMIETSVMNKRKSAGLEEKKVLEIRM